MLREKLPHAGQYGRVGRLGSWVVDLAFEHRHLVAKHDHPITGLMFLTDEPDQQKDTNDR